MNKKLSRALSTVLAFAMIVSCLTVVNVTSVFAAVTTTTGLVTNTTNTQTDSYLGDAIANSKSDVDSYWIADGTTDGLSNDDNIAVTLTASESNTSYNATKSNGVMFDTSKDGTAVYSKGFYIPSGDSSSVSITTKAAGTLIIDWAADGNKRCAAISDGTNTVDIHDNNGNNQYGVQTWLETDADKTYTITHSNTTDEDKNVYIYAVAFVSSEPAVNGVITLVDDESGNGTTTVKVDGVDLVSGDEYTADSTVVVKAEANEGYVATVTVNGTEVELDDENSYTFTVDDDATIVVTYSEEPDASTMTKSFDLSFSSDVTQGEDLGNGVYALYDMTYTSSSKTFDGSRTRAGYITNSDSDANPKDSTDTTGSDITYPVSGVALKFVVETSGTLIIDYYIGSGKTCYVKSLTTGGDDSTLALVDSYTSGSSSETTFISFAVEKGKTYYFFGQGTKLRFYGVNFTAEETSGGDGGGTTSDMFEYDAFLYDYDAKAMYLVGKIKNDAKGSYQAVGFSLAKGSGTAYYANETYSYMITSVPDNTAAGVQSYDVDSKKNIYNPTVSTSAMVDGLTVEFSDGSAYTFNDEDYLYVCFKFDNDVVNPTSGEDYADNMYILPFSLKVDCDASETDSYVIPNTAGIKAYGSQLKNISANTAVSVSVDDDYTEASFTAITKDSEN